MQKFQKVFGVCASTRILDLGGTPTNWAFLSVRPRVTLLNITPYGAALAPNMSEVLGSATAVPFDDLSFYIVYSNSVIEHLFSRKAQHLFADEVRRLAPRHYGQTPNYWFPVEPHCWGLGLQYLPRKLRPWGYRYLSVWGWSARPPKAVCEDWADEIRLLSAGDMRALFDDSDLWIERIAGLESD